MPDAFVGQDSDFSEEHRKAFLALQSEQLLILA
jgi:hypothetical protein